jgi:hypothetical protein
MEFSPPWSLPHRAAAPGGEKLECAIKARHWRLMEHPCTFIDFCLGAFNKGAKPFRALLRH